MPHDVIEDRIWYEQCCCCAERLQAHWTCWFEHRKISQLTVRNDNVSHPKDPIIHDPVHDVNLRANSGDVFMQHKCNISSGNTPAKQKQLCCVSCCPVFLNIKRESTGEVNLPSICLMGVVSCLEETWVGK